MSRKKAEQFLYTILKEITNDDYNTNFYKEFFGNMSDQQFDKFVKELKQSKNKLPIYSANFDNTKMSIENNIKVAKKYFNHDFFKQLWVGPKNNEVKYLTPVKYMVVDLPVRRAAQRLDHKISVPENNKVIDSLTGQPTGASKGSRLSYPSAQVLSALGLTKSLTEIFKYRGGDTAGFSALNLMLSRYGTATQQNLANFSSGVESTKTLYAYLSSMHLKNNLNVKK